MAVNIKIDKKMASLMGKKEGDIVKINMPRYNAHAPVECETYGPSYIPAMKIVKSSAPCASSGNKSCILYEYIEKISEIRKGNITLNDMAAAMQIPLNEIGEIVYQKRL